MRLSLHTSIGLLTLVVAAGLQAQADPGLAPAPELTPTEVVQIQLEALQRDGAKKSDIATAYRFSSPANRASVGSLSDFTRMIEQGYSDMQDYETAEYAEPLIQGREALQGVLLKLPDGSQSQYIFILSRQTGPPCRECWMTDGVLQPQPTTPEVEGGTI